MQDPARPLGATVRVHRPVAILGRARMYETTLVRDVLQIDADLRAFNQPSIYANR